MSLGDRVWDAFTTVVQMRDKIAQLVDTVKNQQSRIEDLTERMVKLETTIDLFKNVALSRQTKLHKENES